MSNKFEHFFASIYLAVVGDKIGFGNGQREKNYNLTIAIDKDENDYLPNIEGLSIVMIFKFIEEGGIIGLDMELLIPSDDTLMHSDTIQGFINPYSNRDELYNEIVKLYLDTFKDISYMRDTLLAGRQTLEAIKNINAGINWKNFPYSKSAGGSGGPMRTMCIGLCFYQTNNLLKLIESSIMITSITHPNCTAFIGSIVSALFTSYAIRDMNPETWIFELIRLLESETIDNIIEKIKPNYIENFKEDKKDFLYKLRTYVEDSFDEYNYNISNLRRVYPYKRMLYYFEKFSSNKKYFYPGSGADDVIIIAYDCLLMSKSNYEKLIYTAMINIGDSDTIGTIASAWYGALYGFDNVPSNLINKNEADYIRTNIMSTKIHEKYYEKTIKDF
jgi:ADP-ribosylarginine hydrolase